ncbi:MAG: beta-Ala-His dipeptidase, partial [Promethearchaeota archaeon]
DNGVGIAYMLTLMKKSYLGELDVGPLELLFTVDEEVGLCGAFQIEKDLIDGNYLINLDSEEENAITIGNAGGITTKANFKVKYENIYNFKKEVVPVKLSIKGLIGGHSGVDIHRGHSNALKVLAKVLWKLNNKFSIEIKSIDGGNRPNAIPREAQSIFFVNKNQFTEIMNFINIVISEIKQEISKIEPNIKITLEEIEKIDTKILPNKVKEKLIYLLYVIPNGPISNHPKIQNLIHTSTNLASINTNNNSIIIITSQRSFDENSKKDIYEKIEALFKLADMNIDIQYVGDYPSWPPNFNSKLLRIAKETYEELFNEKVIVKAIHAGLETGILKKQFPEIEMISIGPTVEGAHSPNERLRIKDVEKIWRFLISLLKKLF